MGPITIALILVGVAAFLLALDLLVPSGGVLLALALMACAGSILFAFRHSYDAGIWMLIAELACVPLAAWLFLKLWPNTPFGKRMIIGPAEAKPYTWDADSMLGKTGITVCDLVPAGVIEIAGRRWEATSRSGLINQGSPVKIVAEEMGQLFVVPISKASTTMNASTSAKNSLDQPADDIGIDSLLLVLLASTTLFCAGNMFAQEAAEKFVPSDVVRAAAEGIDEASLRGPMRFLADDLLEGRGPGTTADALTQLYVSTQLESFGFKPAAENGAWIQPVPMIGVATRCPPTMSIQGKEQILDLRFFDDYIANCGQPKESIAIKDAELVFVGYGIQAPEYAWDDFKGQDLRGKILVMMNNDPEDDPELFAGKRRLYYGRWSYKYESAARQGAAGAIIIHTTPSAGYPFSVVQTSWTGEEFELQDTTSSRLSMKAWVTEEAARRIVSQSGLDLDRLREQARHRDFQPVALGSRLSIELASQVRTKETGNVLGVLEGSDEKLKEEYLVLMAHHDHLGMAESRDQNGDNIYNGAIDNASGTATMLCLAKAFASMPIRTKRSILVCAVGAEEQGLLGSSYLASNPPVPPEKMAALINIDGINHLGPSRDVHLIGAGKSSLDAIVASVSSYQQRVVTPDLFPDKGTYYRSDQFSLAKIGVPGVYLQSGTNIRDRPNGWGKEQLDQWIELHYHQRSDEYDANWDLRGAVEDAQLLFYVGWLASDAPNMQSWHPGDEFERHRK